MRGGKNRHGFGITGVREKVNSGCGFWAGVDLFDLVLISKGGWAGYCFGPG